MDSFTVDKKDNYTLVTTHVEKLDSRFSPDLKADLVQIGNGGEKNVIIDLSNSRYCDSSGLSALLVANRLCRDANGTFVITGLQDSVSKLISISQLDNVLNITATLDDAVKLMNQDGIGRDSGDEAAS